MQTQYGIFPDDFTFNLLLDSYIKDGDFKSKALKMQPILRLLVIFRCAFKKIGCDQF